MKAQEPIRILMNDDALLLEERGGGFTIKSIDPEVLTKNISDFIDALSHLPDYIKNSSNSLRIKKMVFNLDVNAEGKVSILGSGVSSSFRTGISLHLEVKD